MPLDKSYCKPVYLINEVAKLLDIHPQTLRQYEREGFIKPSRTNGKIRLYSQQNIDFIKYILTLTRKEGINLAGVHKVLKLEHEIGNLKNILKEYQLNTDIVSNQGKALIVKKYKYDMVIYKT